MIKHTHGGRREGEGRPKRTDGRITMAYKVAVTPEEAKAIREQTTPDERRKAILTYIESKQRDC